MTAANRARAATKIVRVAQRSGTQEVTTKGQGRRGQCNRERQCVFRCRVDEPHCRVFLEASLNFNRLRVRIQVVIIITNHVSSVLRRRFVIYTFLHVIACRMTFPLLNGSIVSGSFFALRIVPSDLHFVEDLSVLGRQFPLLRSREISRSANVSHATIRIRNSGFNSRLSILMIRLSVSVRVNGSSLYGSGEIVNEVCGKDIRKLFLFLRQFHQRYVNLRCVNFRYVIFRYISSR